MAFGVTATFRKSGNTIKTASPYEARKAFFEACPDKSVSVATIYAHGAPGLIGDDEVEDLTVMLGPKMVQKGTIYLWGCSTAGIEADCWSPIQGLGLYLRMAMYHGLPKIQGNPDIAIRWARNLAGDLSRSIPDVYVMGLAGISFPLSRLNPWEGYEPSLLFGGEFTYLNGRLAKG